MKAKDKEHANGCECHNWEEKYKRARADYINLERRVEKQREEIIDFANAALILKLLPIVDDLEKAVEAGLDDGVKIILRNLKETLEGEGTEELNVSVGSEFDPETMEGVTLKGRGSKVAKVLRKGYKFRGKVLRPAQVEVGKNE